MAHITFSVVTTVFNEEKNIEAMIHSLLIQSLLPSEIIVVDAGSTDDTVQLIRSVGKNSPVPIHLFIHPGVNRSVGRNIGIAQVKNRYIAVTDAGCEADEHWLEELSFGFKNDVQVVAGFYTPVINNPIQRLFSVYVSTLPKNLDETTYLPSSRSLAFTKEVWEEIGKYPEYLNTCEDLVFAAKLKQTGKMGVRRRAIVLWHQADGFGGFFTQIRGYARGDVEAGYMPHVLKIASIWIRYVFIILFWPLLFVYILYPVVKHRREISDTRDVFLLPAVQLVADGAVMVGSLEGFGNRLGFGSR